MAEVDQVEQEVTPEERAIEMKKLMNAARGADEKFDEYQVRRRAVNKMIKERLRSGAYIYENKFVPVPGEIDAETGETRQRGVPYVKEEVNA